MASELVDFVVFHKLLSFLYVVESEQFFEGLNKQKSYRFGLVVLFQLMLLLKLQCVI